jgi:magnesium transporter
MENEKIEIVSQHAETLQEKVSAMSSDDRVEYFMSLSRDEAEDLFLDLPPEDQKDIFLKLNLAQKRTFLRMLSLDDMADLIQQLPENIRYEALNMLDTQTKMEVIGLLVYAEDMAGGVMTPHFLRLRPDMEVEVAIRYLRTYSKHHEETIYYTCVVDNDDKLLGVVSFRDLLLSPPEKKINQIMETEHVSVLDTMDQEEVAQVFSSHELSAIPVVDKDGHIKGVITYDDIAHVIEEEATEDIQRIGGMEALDVPYWKTDFLTMAKKRAGWLIVLLVGGSLTATAMAVYEQSLEKAVVLGLFLPLIISSGGNSGSQAATLIIRSLALKEVRIKDWFKILLRESASGLVLGLTLGIVGFLRIIIWPNRETLYGAHYMMLAVTVAISLVGVVIWGTVAGAMLPFILRKFKADPARASAPLVATIVDVTGIVIYFTVATMLLKGTLL